MGSSKTNSKEVEDEPEFLKDLSYDDNDELEGWDSFCLDDEYDNDNTEQEDVELLDDKEKTVWRAVKVWEQYSSQMITEIVLNCLFVLTSSCDYCSF